MISAMIFLERSEYSLCTLSSTLCRNTRKCRETLLDYLVTLAALIGVASEDAFPVGSMHSVFELVV